VLRVACCVLRVACFPEPFGQGPDTMLFASAKRRQRVESEGQSVIHNYKVVGLRPTGTVPLFVNKY